MSLTLRTKCQPILDEHDLQGFHVDVHRQLRYLQIVAECGKPLANIEGIRFSRITPSNSEINAAVPLFSQYMLQYRDLVHEVWHTRIALRAFPDQPYSDMIHTNSVGPYALLSSFQKWDNLDPEDKAAVGLDGDVVYFFFSTMHRTKKQLPLDVVLHFKSEYLELFLDRAQQVKIWEEQHKSLTKDAEEARAALDACDI